MSRASDAAELPEAQLRPERQIKLIWLLPAAAAILALWIGYRSWSLRGLEITVQLENGHGLAPGADVRYSGIVVGQVAKVELTDDSSGVTVTASLFPHAEQLARAGARFWVVRPQLDVTGVAGLETVVGPRYLAMLPGDGPRRRHFLGLSEPPIVETIEPGDLEITLEASKRGGLRPGAPVLYRQVPVGTILSVGLSSDGGAVEARVHVQQAYRQLIHERTRFWDVGGIQAQLGLRGVSIEVDSVESLLAGGVALATPPEAGPVVRNGHRFKLADKPESEWLEWRPPIMIGNAFLPPGSILPTPLRAVAAWSDGLLIKRKKTRRGWVLQTHDGLLGPQDLLQPAGSNADEPPVLEIAGRELPLTFKQVWTKNGLALVDVQVSPLGWPAARQRSATEPEDCIAIADRASSPLALAATRLSVHDNSAWLIDPVISLDHSWHGAAVLSRVDGKLLGMVLVDEDRARVALLPPDLK